VGEAFTGDLTLYYCRKAIIPSQPESWLKASLLEVACAVFSGPSTIASLQTYSEKGTQRVTLNVTTTIIMKILE
jgi:hypothetical protein